MALIRPIPKSDSNDVVMCSISPIQGERHAACFTDNNLFKTVVMPSNTQPVSINGSDFSCGLGTIDSTLTVKKAGTYLINNNGSESTRQIAANGTVTIPANYTAGWYWYILKLD